MTVETTPRKFKPYTRQTIALARQWRWMAPDLQEAVHVVSRVMPFRTNEFVMERLIDWNNARDDPIFRLTFPQREMLAPNHYEQLRELVLFRKDESAIARLVRDIRTAMEPHPARPARPGALHRHPATVQFFAGAGQACHACATSCSACLPRSPGAVEDRKFGAHQCGELVAYLAAHREARDVLITGGDPLAMTAGALAACIEPLLVPQLAHIENIRIGTRSLACWPQRFVGDPDSGQLLRLFERVVEAGKNLAVMGHYSHAAELRSEIAQQAVRRIVATGATLRMQGALARHVNDDAHSWAELWSTGVRLGAVPYAMSVQRDTGANRYFSLSLARAHGVFRSACQMVSGLSRTVRGPTMDAFPGKVVIDGIVTINGEKLFALQFLQARNPDWERTPFFASFDPDATWLDQLAPAFGMKRFFFEAGDAPAGPAPQGRVIALGAAQRLEARACGAQTEAA